MTDERQLIGNAHVDKKDDPELLAKQLHSYQRLQLFATSRKARCEELMRRRSAKKWDAAKKARMVRKLMTANKELETSTGMIEQLMARLTQLWGEANAQRTFSPFVPPPATTT